MSEDNEALYHGRITFDMAVPTDRIPRELQALAAVPLTVSLLYAGTAAAPALAGIEAADDDDGWARPDRWDAILLTLEAIARHHQRALILDTPVTYESDISDHQERGILVVDQGGRFHHCPTGDTPEPHRTRTCTCYIARTPDSSLFAIDQPTVTSLVRIDELPAGPFTDYPVRCSDHGEVACPTNPQEALWRREAHLIDHHTPRPLPLGPTPALQALPPHLRDHIQQAARALHQARFHSLSQAISYRETANDHLRQAHEAALTHATPQELIPTLVAAMVELTADLAAPR